MTPVGVLGWTAEEHEEHARTEQWPERAVEVGDQNPGFSLRGYGAPASVGFDYPNSKNSHKLLAQIRALADALRDYWRLDGKLEGLDEGLEKGRLEGLEKGRVEGREEVLREALWVAKNGATAKSLADNRGAGRPSSLDEETREMLGIIGDNPNHGERYCRHLFEAALRKREHHPKDSKSDYKRWLNQRSKRAWEAAQKQLSGQVE
jgi:hypothetical protein